MVQVGNVYGAPGVLAGTAEVSEESAQGQEFVKAWDDLTKAGKNFSKTNPAVLEKYMKLSGKNKEAILKFSDGSPNYTLSKFLDEADDATLAALNKNENIAEALVGHKLDYKQADYENIAEVLDDIEGVVPSSKKFMEDWLERSAGLSKFTGAAKLGNELNANILKSLVDGTRIKNLLKTKLNTDLDGYVVFQELPIKVPISTNTPGGFMKADVVLIKYDELGEIDDIIVIENKLRGTTDFTPAQTSKFTDVKSAPAESTVGFEIKFGRTSSDGSKTLNAESVLNVSRDRVLKISDSGTNSIDQIDLQDIQFIKDLDF